MSRPVSRRILSLAIALACMPLSASVPTRAATLLLPDLAMAEPYNLRVETRPNGRRLLHFGTIVWNVGDGPLEIRSRDRDGHEMSSVVQRIATAEGGFVAYRPAGARTFYSGDGHDHWHVESFIDVALEPTRTDSSAPATTPRTLRKIGFCLVDLVRAPAELRPPNASLKRRFGTAGCGDLQSTSLRMGISAGWGDDDRPFFTHQWVNVTNLPAGTYRLCSTVNWDGLWRERADNTANNVHWLDLSLDPLAGTVTVAGQGTTDCGAPAPPPPAP
jgi:hypothetical protein